MQQADGFKIFVGCLPSDITREELQIVFQTYGQVTDIHVMPAAKSSTGHACAFVSYAKRESGEDAITVLDGIYKIREGGAEILPIKVSWAKPSGSGSSSGKGKGDGCKGKGDGGKGGFGKDSWQAGGPWNGGDNWQGSWQGGRNDTWSDGWQGNNWASPPGGKGWSGDYQQKWSGKDAGKGGACGGSSGSSGRLFVGNLPSDISEEALEYVFGNYGKVVQIHVMSGRSKSGQSCAFVEYSKTDEAETAILTLHEKYEIRPGDGTIMVKHANSTRSLSRPY